MLQIYVFVCVCVHLFACLCVCVRACLFFFCVYVCLRVLCLMLMCIRTYPGKKLNYFQKIVKTSSSVFQRRFRQLCYYGKNDYVLSFRSCNFLISLFQVQFLSVLSSRGADYKIMTAFICYEASRSFLGVPFVIPPTSIFRGPNLTCQ